MRNKLDVTVWSLDDITRHISKKRTGLNIVSIRSSNIHPDEYAAFEKYRANYKDMIVECFDDIMFPEENCIMPLPEHITRILGWAEDKENIAVHCTAGVSRSAAVAYLIACQRSSPKKAVAILDPARHNPNRLVLNIGRQVLKDDAVCTEYVKWFMKHYG